MIEPPGLLHGGIGGKGLAIAAMQALPVLLQRGTGVDECLVRMRKRFQAGFAVRLIIASQSVR
jgi:hypothetical protein